MKTNATTDKSKKPIVQRTLRGEVVSNKGDKTIVVSVSQTKYHPKYGKQYSTTKKYKAHDEHNTAQVGDTVAIVACRPISKDKRWRLVK
ncbi:MAG: 30S ribosomal protein S17 [Candidatus Buchananbacteria bacterium RIFCSPHIGHO2_01_FULL_47_11b]|uniref:Small ribosomal subunit protein uS17 n=1 Tax=Candidatus Buchananbacteria bacterium RIFCSPHIGHO2_01_FULL_47_11b TaxID=1797537 RepID=A0A1G1Y2Q7_9BACT|nr:MAG: 30S ribosomal protein S17 [Candidatus Buchananbacteria bacterium RIFCSPHIGHO2_01_FULL_47_11b]